MPGKDGAFNLFRLINRKHLIILYYHRIVKKDQLANIKNKNSCVDVDAFYGQMKLISDLFNPVSEKEIISAIEGEHKLPDYSIWVTLDDGYKDLYTNAFPILRKHKIPATLFITTGFINKTAMPYDDFIANAFRLTDLKEAKVVFGDKEYVFNLDSEELKTYAIRTMWDVARNLRRPTEEFIEELVDSLKVRKEDIHGLFMDWDELKTMRGDLSIGSHTVNHKLLSTIAEQEMVDEILNSKNEIESRLNVEVFSFAYPKGKRNHYNLKVCHPLLEKCGYKLAVSSIGGVNDLFLDKNYYSLKRLGLSYDDSINFFKLKISTGSFWQL